MTGRMRSGPYMSREGRYVPALPTVRYVIAYVTVIIAWMSC